MNRNVDKLLDALNEPQREAVCYRGGPLMVLAGAGSGKTRVVTYRVAHLIKTGDASPWNILAVTFTNKAAREMKERIWALLGQEQRELWVGTFHSTCARVLRGHAHLLGFPSNFTILDERDQLSLARECCQELNLDAQRFSPSFLLHHVSIAKQNFTGPDEYARRWGEDYLRRHVARFYNIYQERLKKARAMDFDDLLFMVLKLFMEHPGVLDLYRNRWKHILVDEFQDTNQIQYLITKALAEKHRQICVVGDDDQSIYSWRGADPENMLIFDRDFPEVHIVRLEQNYRSTGNIIEASSALISRNRTRKGKELWTSNEKGEMVAIYMAENERDEARFIAMEIRRLLQECKARPGDIGVFYRTHAQSRVLEEELLGLRIPFAIYGGTGFFERKEIKDMVAYLRALMNHADDISWKRILNVPRRGLGAKSLKAVEELARTNSIAFSEALRMWGGDPGSRGARKVMEFLGLMEDLKRVLTDQGVSACLKALLDRTGYLQELKESEQEQSVSREENIEALINMAVEYEAEHGKSDPIGFLERVSLLTDLDLSDTGEEKVSLMTLHSAKGLEFAIVFIVGLEEGLLPHHSSAGDQASLEEERRLCYVGMTRARNRLYLCLAASRRVWGLPQNMAPSRFLSELPAKCIELLNPWENGDPVPVREGSPSAPIIGRWVRHKAFGAGTVVRLEQGGDRLVVHFPGVGEKRFITKEAPLEWL